MDADDGSRRDVDQGHRGRLRVGHERDLDSIRAALAGSPGGGRLTPCNDDDDRADPGEGRVMGRAEYKPCL